MGIDCLEILLSHRSPKVESRWTRVRMKSSQNCEDGSEICKSHMDAFIDSTIRCTFDADKLGVNKRGEVLLPTQE